MKIRLIVSVTALALAVLACAPLGSPGPNTAASASELQAALAALPAGDAARGQQVFSSAQPCHVCHMDQPIGPKFPGDPPLAARAASRRPGYTAELYLYESMVNPGAYVVPGFQDGIMPGDFGKTLTQQELADLVAYLKTLQ
jgi:mono/diheme cytochrome c family protein